MDLISHPFRLEANGSVATVVDDTDDAYAEGIAVLLGTRPGERPLVPDFGVPDPTFTDVTLADLTLGLLDYGPPVHITAVTIDRLDDRTERVELAFTAEDEDED